MSNWKESSRNRRDERQAPTDVQPKPQRAKKAKPVVVEYRWMHPYLKVFRDWVTFKRYRTVEEAIRVIEIQNRKDSGFAEYRLKEDHTDET